MAVIANGAHVFVACGSELASGHLKLLQKAHTHSSHSVFSMSTFIQKLLICLFHILVQQNVISESYVI